MNYSAHIATIAFVLSGCVRPPAPVIQTTLDALKGHPVKEVVDKLGAPASQTEADGKKTFAWTTSIPAQCALTVFAGKDDKIADYDFKGTIGGCGHFAHLLDSSYHEVQDMFKPW
ncbi:MAG TPA: hypothetical protein VKS78_17460 [Roseiarcus sp.]|nr:hypothetical protein [Roseiarcus sp.]